MQICRTGNLQLEQPSIYLYDIYPPQNRYFKNLFINPYFLLAQARD